MSELLIRPGLSDHRVVADLLAPGATTPLRRARPLISRLVVDAHIAGQRPELAEAASRSGISFLVDPLSPLLQGELRPDDPWARLPYGTSQPVPTADLAHPLRLQRLISEVVTHQIQSGASAVIPPYLYATAPDDPRFTLSLEMIRLTDRFLEREKLRLPMVPIFCAQLHSFAHPSSWPHGVDRFRAVAMEYNVQFLALCLSPAGDGVDSYEKLLGLFQVAQRLHGVRRRVIAWRQGIYGPALVAAGLDGYETGMGTRERCDMAALVSNRKPPRTDKARSKGGAAPGMYLETLGRSFVVPTANILLSEPRIRPQIVCDDEGCCPNGVTSMLNHSRQHAVRTRARILAMLDAMPERRWRLHRIAQHAANAVVIAHQANRILRREGARSTIRFTGMEALARLAEHLKSVGETPMTG